MRNHTKTLGVAAAFTAIALSIPTAIAYGEPDPTPAPEPTATAPLPAGEVPNPQGSYCDKYKEANPTGPGSVATMATEPASVAIAGNPDLSTFSAAISGGLNPAVNIVNVLDNGPYNVFAPTNEAFAALEPAELEALKADPAKLLDTVYYHIALGFLGPDDVHGKLTSQQGAQITVTGTGGDIKVDDVAKVVCGGLTSLNAKIYMIDTVLDPADALPANATTTTSPTSTTETTSETTSSETSTESSSTETTETTTEG